MSRELWRRLPLERKHLLLIAVVVFIVIVASGFSELYNIQAELEVERAAAQVQVQQLQEQNQQLKDALGAAQTGQNIEPMAREYFQLGRRGEKRVLAQPVAAPTPVPSAPSGSPPTPAGPFWQQWWQTLVQP